MKLRSCEELLAHIWNCISLCSLPESDNYDGDCDFFSEDYEDCLKTQCRTIDGASCVFPFIFRGKEISNCISTPPRRTQAWCPTEIQGVRGAWGYCEDQWFKTESCNNGCHGNY